LVEGSREGSQETRVGYFVPGFTVVDKVKAAGG